MAHENQGHRARLRARMQKEGLSSFQDHEVLELLLFQYLPYKDTNKIAHNLLNNFGGFAGVLNASPQQLMTVEGISEVTACNLAVLKEVFRRYKLSDSQKISLKGLSSIILYARRLIADSYKERLVAVYVDGATNFLYQEEFTSENVDNVNIDCKKLVATATRVNAAGVVIFHCHVSGPCQPSDADCHFTEKLYFALASINIVLLEHMIFNAAGEYYSFFSEGKIKETANKFVQTLN
ncbi:MAG: RadC family protein [Clostridiales bacterium]|nr:RadC family protein [Clostridiales bacterium]